MGKQGGSDFDVQGEPRERNRMGQWGRNSIGDPGRKVNTAEVRVSPVEARPTVHVSRASRCILGSPRRDPGGPGSPSGPGCMVLCNIKNQRTACLGADVDHAGR